MDAIDCGIFRILVPFEELTTTVYVYVCVDGVAIIDSATYPSDVDRYIMPSLDEIGIAHEQVTHLLLTHHHDDHAGGIRRLAEIFPAVTVGTSFPTDLPNRVALIDRQRVLGDLYAVALPGHTDTSFGFYDAATRTLLSGDCLQLNGVGKYRNGIGYPDRYIESVECLKQMDIDRIVAAHEYDPLGSIACGKPAVDRYLTRCIDYANDKRSHI